MKVPKREWEWFGNAGHLCVSASCRFHLCTLVGPWIVSTVGEYYGPEDIMGKGPHEVGLNRMFETMVFPFDGERCNCGCGLPMPSSWDGEEMDGYNTAAEANAGHVAMCERFAAKAAA